MDHKPEEVQKEHSHEAPAERVQPLNLTGRKELEWETSANSQQTKSPMLHEKPAISYHCRDRRKKATHASSYYEPPSIIPSVAKEAGSIKNKASFSSDHLNKKDWIHQRYTRHPTIIGGHIYRELVPFCFRNRILPKSQLLSKFVSPEMKVS